MNNAQLAARYSQVSTHLRGSPAGILLVELHAYLLWQRPNHLSCPPTEEYLRTHLDYEAHKRQFGNIFQD